MVNYCCGMPTTDDEAYEEEREGGERINKKC